MTFTHDAHEKNFIDNAAIAIYGILVARAVQQHRMARGASPALASAPLEPRGT